MALILFIAVPFAVIFLGGAAVAWWACERFLAFVRQAGAGE
jgi:hypothetical protein